jgi:hypothetical protein
MWKNQLPAIGSNRGGRIMAYQGLAFIKRKIDTKAPKALAHMLLGVLLFIFVGCSGNAKNSVSISVPTSAPDVAHQNQDGLKAEPEAAVYTRSDGTLVVNGGAFFPIGIYHVSYVGTDAERLAALQAIAAAGFNMIHPALDSGDGSFLDEAAALGVYVQVEFNEHWPTVVNTHKDHPAILGWNIGDDVEDEFTPGELQAMQDAVKALDPDHITSIGTYDPDRFGPYITIPDVAGVYSYPVPHEGLETVDWAISEAAGYGQVVWGVPQAFAWPGETPPTGDELRNMTYQMLINGVKGLLYYTYLDSSWDMGSQPGFWADLRALIPEIEAMSAVYTDGTRTKVTHTGAADVFAAEWVYGPNSYVVVVNTSGSNTRDVSIRLPSGRTGGTLQVLFAGGPDGMVYANGVLSGPIAPLEARVYSFEAEVTQK